MRQLNRREFLKVGLSAGVALLSSGFPSWSAEKEHTRKLNVLFIAVDDLRPQAGCYGHPIMKTPNIDALAATGTLFNRAYCQQAVCSPSRTSLLTGRRPDTTRIYDLQTHFRKTIPDVITLPEHFKMHGYHTQALSKVYHNGLDDPQSWSVPHWTPHASAYAKPETLEALKAEKDRLRALGVQVGVQEVLERDPRTGLALKIKQGTRVKGPSWEDPDVPDNALADGMTADKAIELLRELKDRPFFLAVGFLKPHLPFVAPKKYFELYDRSQIRPAPNPYPPIWVPDLAMTEWGELRAYSDIPKRGPLSRDKARELIHAYYAATSYVDAQIGRVLTELERLGLADKTVVVLWGDHGWHLGEHGLWCKHTNFEEATRSLLIMRVPGQRNKGAKTDALVEFVDIYPTLREVCGLPLPEGLEGTSFLPVIEQPDRRWKKAAFSQYPRGSVMGYSIRTDRYRYTEWLDRSKTPVGIELYDHAVDPGENVNLANRTDYRHIAKELAEMLRRGWKSARP
ncbi:MAG: sulfatase [Armatimonadota bacterium]|nr:sulfatase [Armatimonadota bacterium]